MCLPTFDLGDCPFQRLSTPSTNSVSPNERAESPAASWNGRSVVNLFSDEGAKVAQASMNARLKRLKEFSPQEPRELSAKRVCAFDVQNKGDQEFPLYAPVPMTRKPVLAVVFAEERADLLLRQIEVVDFRDINNPALTALVKELNKLVGSLVVERNPRENSLKHLKGVIFGYSEQIGGLRAKILDLYMNDLSSKKFGAFHKAQIEAAINKEGLPDNATLNSYFFDALGVYLDTGRLMEKNTNADDSSGISVEKQFVRKDVKVAIDAKEAGSFIENLKTLSRIPAPQ